MLTCGKAVCLLTSYVRLSVRSVQPEDPSSSVSLVQGKMAVFEPSQRQSGAGVVPWSPPQVNWNPWTSSNIDEGPLAFVSVCAVSQRRCLVFLLAALW